MARTYGKSLYQESLVEAINYATECCRLTGHKWIVLFNPNWSVFDHKYIVCPEFERDSFATHHTKMVHSVSPEEKSYQNGYDEGYEMGLKDGQAENGI